ncbi:D-aminoacylase [Tissierella sp. Yu-01]|uniref:N-acyl-D-amino-acid deacylase family protein n=1 Tax=Tissierella sp. Yu-01 TaxID=3035694 RepID=UPI00240D1DA3|nr:D-aminoacylase [Tissierella sp. Yu-01]WFA10059.1 D-aminoacylase [Tissierella sp. Yu-01]
MYDLVISNGLIVDGSGSVPFIGNIGIIKDKISFVSTHDLEGKRSIKAEGLIVSPGFIDVHSHSDASFMLGSKLESKVFQGVTTEIIGNCGISLFPAPNNEPYCELLKKYCAGLIEGVIDVEDRIRNIEDYKNIFIDKKNTINCGVLIGHGTLRICAMGFDNRVPNESEMEVMKELLDVELRNGALGMSLGLIYPPGSFADINELVELAKVLKKHDAILTAHMRNENTNIIDSINEMINIAKSTGVHVHISHLKVMGKSNWGKSKEVIGLIEEANKNGAFITFDQYPYNASNTTLTALVPSWAHEGGTYKMLNRLSNESDEIEPQITKLINERGGPDRIKISHTYGKRPEYDGMFLSNLSEEFGVSPAKTVIKVLIETEGEASGIYYSMDDDDVNYILSQHNMIVGSDGYGIDYINYKHKGKPHPRSFGTFPRYFRLSKENSNVKMEEVIRKVTGLPAEYFGLKNIGIIKEGNYADLSIFDWDKFKDNATYENPFQKPEGLHYVIVSGQVLIDNGELTDNKAGRMI